MKVTSANGWAIFNEGPLVLLSVKTKPEGFEVVKPSRSYAAFSDLEIVNSLDKFPPFLTTNFSTMIPLFYVF